MSHGTSNFVICTESDFGLEMHMDCSCIVVSNSDSQEFLCNAYSSIYRLSLKMNTQTLKAAACILLSVIQIGSFIIFSLKKSMLLL